MSSGLVLYTAVFFWVWALRNVLLRRVPFDMGLVSFSLAAITHWFALSSARLHSKLTAFNEDTVTTPLDTVMKRAKTYNNMVLWAHLVVTFNYVGGFLVYPSVALKVYCGVFGMIWLLYGLWLNCLSSKWYDLVVSDDGEEGGDIEEEKRELKRGLREDEPH